jgi:hypothetical protein
VDVAAKQLHKNTKPLEIPDFVKFQRYDEVERHPAKVLEESLHDDLDEILPYRITEAHTKSQRQAIGLRFVELETMSRLLSTKTHIAGIHSPQRAYTGFHKEDFGLHKCQIRQHQAPLGNST